MSIFEYYSQEFKGQISEAVVIDLERPATDLIEMYVKSRCFDKTKTLNCYGKFDKAICYQIELLNQIGLDCMNGASGENDISTIKTGNYEIQVNASRRNQFIWRGQPFHSLAKTIIDMELRKNGLLSMGIYP